VSALARAPTREQGTVRPDVVWSGRWRIPGWGVLPPPDERVPALQWPRSLTTYAAMLDDPRVWALWQLITLPPHRYRVALVPRAADPEVAALLADDLDLPLGRMDGERLVIEPAPDERDPLRFSHRRHMTREMWALRDGHAVFEIVGEIDEQGLWRLRDLAPRPARTLRDWHIDKQGRLLWIDQDVGEWEPARLRADHLVVYTWGGEPGDPRGRSMLRPLYRPWLAKDMMVRIDGVKQDRNAMGVPWGEAPEGASRADIDRFSELLSRLAAGEDTNVVVPHGARFGLAGVSGSTSSPIDSARFHNEEMAVALGGQVLQTVGQSYGSRALAETHKNLLDMYLDVLVNWRCDVLNEQLVKRWVAWNFGPDAPCPKIVWQRDEHEDGGGPLERAERAGLALQRMGLATYYGIVSADEARAISGLNELEGPPPPAEPSGAVERLAPVAANGRRGRLSTSAPTLGRARRPVAAAADVPLPDRRLRRQPTRLEEQSRIDFAELEHDWTTVRDAATVLLARYREAIAAAIVDAIAEMDTVEPLTLADALAPVAATAAASMDVDRLARLMDEAATVGAGQVAGEIARQGGSVDIAPPDYRERAGLEARAAVARLARGLVETAVNAATARAAPGAPGREVAATVTDAIGELTDAQPRDTAGGMASRAINAGRAHALDAAPYRQVYASALLDTNTCQPCIDWDGTTWESLDEALQQFPGGGGNRDCQGGARCRCVLVGVLESEQEVAA